jgi:hypothetical protein
MDNTIAQSSQKVNPLLQRIQMPGETFTLPSGGIFYANGELDPSVKNAEVRVHPMAAIDEIMIKTPDMLFSGDAVRQIFARCIPQITNVDGLLAKDVDFLLVCLRKVSYGDTVEIEHKHNCKDAKRHSYMIDINQFIRTAKRIDPTAVGKEFCVTMPNGQVVQLQPIRYADFVGIMQINTNEEDSTPELIRDTMVRSISNIIVRVDDVEDKGLIQEWLSQVPPMFTKKINENVDKTLAWGPEFRVELECKDCGEKMQVMAPLNPLSFFT